MSCLVGECQSKNSYKLWISFSWANVQSASSGICAWLHCHRSSQESPTEPGLGVLDPAGAFERSSSAGWNAAAVDLPPGAEPCQHPALSSHISCSAKGSAWGLEGRAFNLLLWKWLLCGFRKPGWVNLQPEQCICAEWMAAWVSLLPVP